MVQLHVVTTFKRLNPPIYSVTLFGDDFWSALH